MQLGKHGAIKVLHYGKDGGPKSKVWGFWIVGIKKLFSIVLLKFEDGSRDAFHSHAFNCFSWVLKGSLVEIHKDGSINYHKTSLLPFTTKRTTFHKVISVGRSYILSIRGPWSKTWEEYIPNKGFQTLTNGREIV